MGETQRVRIQGLVNARVKCRLERDYAGADVLLEQLREEGVLVHDIPYTQGGGCTWSTQIKMDQDGEERSLMQIVRDIEAGIESDISMLKRKLKNNEEITLSRDKQLSGRAYADAAFSLALGGVEDPAVFDLLVQGASSELNRCAHRASFRPIDILMIVEKFAVAGVRDPELYSLAATKLRERGQDVVEAYTGAVERLEGNFSLLEDRPLFWLFRHSARDKKAGMQMLQEHEEEEHEEAEHEEEEHEEQAEQEGLYQELFEPLLVQPDALFADPTLPLVIDLGCGYGVSLMGLCYKRQESEDEEVNFLGVDMKTKAIRYANSVSKRWDIATHCAFIELDALSALRWARERYLGPVRWIMCQFPSPFALQDGSGGNCQLPDLSTFIVNREVILEAEALLSKGSLDGVRGLLLQSQVEDVMIAMKGLVDSTTKLRVAPDPTTVQWGAQGDSENVVPTEGWVSEAELKERSRGQLSREGSRLSRSLARTGAFAPRACGRGYLASNPLGRFGRTETEVMCEIENRPVHRVAWVASSTN